MEVRVIAGDRHQPPVLIAQLVEQIEAVTPVGQDGAGVIIDLDRVRGCKRTPILDRQLRPRGMGDGDEGARLPRSRRQPWPTLVRPGGGKIEGETSRDDMPVLACGGRHGVNFGADQSRELAGAQLAGIGDRPVEPVEKMIGHLEKIVACALVGVDDVHRI